MAAKPDLSRDAYDMRIWVMDLGSGKPIYVSHGPSDVKAAWSPSGRYLAYQRIDVAKQSSELRLVDIEKGVDMGIARLGAPAVALTWLNEDTLVATVPTKLYEEEPGVKIIRSWPVWFDGRGFYP